MAAKKTVARKKVTRKAPAKRTARKKVTAREPKRIINRKKSTAKSKAKAPAKKQTAAASKVERGATEAKHAEQVKKLVDGGASIAEAAKKVGIATGLAKRLYNKAAVNPKDRIVGSDKEVAKKIAVLRDKENVPWPVIRARTGMSPKQMRDLYEDATGKSWRDSGAAASTNGKPKAKSAAKAKTTAKRTTTKAKANGKTKAAPRARRAKSKSTAKAESAQAPVGQTKREQRSRRNAENEKVLDALHDLDTDNDTIPAMLEGKTITVTFDINGNKQKPREYQVTKVKDVGMSDREGRIVHYLDENKQNRVTSTREITAVK
jgi:hypothetical protein